MNQKISNDRTVRNKNGRITIFVSALLLLTIAIAIVNPVSAGPAISPTMTASRNFAVLAATTITGTATITGDVGIAPDGGASITALTCAMVTGNIYTPDPAGPPGPCHVANSALPQAAQTDLSANVFVQLGGEGCDVTYGASKDLGGLTLVPGVYCDSSGFTINTGETLTLSGGPGNVWVFKTPGSTLTTFANSKVVGGDPCNVWWDVSTSVALGTSSELTGSILAGTTIAFGTGATVNGRVMSSTAAVTLASGGAVTLNCPIVPVTVTTVLESSASGGVTILTSVVLTIPIQVVPEYQWGVWLLLILMLPVYMLLKRRTLNR